jgi:hypothetical protein
MNTVYTLHAKKPKFDKIQKKSSVTGDNLGGAPLKSETVSHTLVVVAMVSSITASVLYNWKTFAGGASPNITSWFLWATITVLNFTSYKSMSKDWIKSALPTTNSLFCILTFFVALCFGKVHAFNGYDIAVLTIGVIAASVWYVFRSSKAGNLLVQVALAVAFIPTFISVTAAPGNEIALSWFLWANGFLFQALVVIWRWKKEWVELVYPVGGVVLHFTVGILALA